MLNTQQKINVILIILITMIIGFFVWNYMYNSEKKAREAEYNRRKDEEYKQKQLDILKSIEPTPEQVELRKSIDSATNRIGQITKDGLKNREEELLKNIDTTTEEGKKIWHDFQKIKNQ